MLVPPHQASPLLAELSEGKVLVPVDDRFASAAPGTFVAGDAASSPYPRAADPAAVSGVVAAEAVLSDLGYREASLPGVPAPECYVDHGESMYGRIRLSYPGGPPPGGQAAISVGAPSAERAEEFEEAHRRWQALRNETLKALAPNDPKTSTSITWGAA